MNCLFCEKPKSSAQFVRRVLGKLVTSRICNECLDNSAEHNRQIRKEAKRGRRRGVKRESHVSC